MTKKNDGPRIDRRGVLKTLGGAGALTSFGSVVQALGGPEKVERVETATRTDSFGTFEAEFGRISVDLEGSDVTRLDAETRTDRIELRTSLGRMVVVIVDSADAPFDATVLDLDSAPSDAVTAEYADAPDETRPRLLSTSGLDGFEFGRGATKREKRALSRKTGIPWPKMDAAYQSEIGGFAVSMDDTADGGATTTVEIDDPSIQEVEASRIADATVGVDDVSQMNDGNCTYDCASCVAGAAGCVACCLYPTLLCLICILSDCGFVSLACTNCSECMSEPVMN